MRTDHGFGQTARQFLPVGKACQAIGIGKMQKGSIELAQTVCSVAPNGCNNCRQPAPHNQLTRIKHGLHIDGHMLIYHPAFFLRCYGLNAFIQNIAQHTFTFTHANAQVVCIHGQLPGNFQVKEAIFANGLGRNNQRTHGHGTAPRRNHIEGFIL